MLFGGKKIKCNVKYKEHKFIYELDKHKTVKDIFNLFSNEKVAQENISSLTIRLCSNKLPFNENDYETPLISFDKDKFNELCFEIVKPYKCSNCQKIISKYCLVCDKYYCPKCKDDEHDGHDFVDIDPTNFKESVYLWNININASLSNDITRFNELKDFIQDNALLTKIRLWKDNLIKKINIFEKFINNICEMCNKIGKNYITKKSELLNKLMLDLSKIEQNMSNELSIGPKNLNNNKYFSFDEAEIYIKQLKTIYNDIKSKNTDIKDLAEMENVSSLNDIMGNISSQIDDLSQNGVKIFDSFKSFFSKYDNLNESTINATIPRYDTCSTSSNILANSANANKMNILLKKGSNIKNMKNKMLNLVNNNNLTLGLKDTTLYSKDSTNSCNTNVKVNRNRRQLNSFNKGRAKNQRNQRTLLYSELNLSKYKLKEGEDNDNPFYSDRYQKYPSIDKQSKKSFLPLITKI